MIEMTKEEKKNNRKILIYAILSVLSFVAVSVGATYAFYVAAFIGNEDNGKIHIQSADVVAIFSSTNTINDTDILPGWSDILEFNIYNSTASENAYGNYSLIWNISTNEINDNHFVYKLIGETYIGEEKVSNDIAHNSVINISKTRIPTSSVVLGTAIINSGVTHKYQLVLTFEETGTNQNEHQGKIFNSTLVATGTPAA